MQITVERTPVETAQALGPLIREHADEGERERRLSRTVLDAMTEAGLLRMYIPQSLGGLEVDPLTQARVMGEVSAYDSAAGWLISAASNAWWLARLPAGGADEIYADGPNTLVTAAVQTPMQATEVAGGYRISGRSGLASFIHAADWVVVIGLVMDGDQPRTVDGVPQAIGAVLRTDECQILDTWHSLGMRATDSADVSVTDVFVPAARTYRVVAEFEPGPHYRGPIYRTPAMVVVGLIAPLFLAMARRAIEELRTLAERKTPFASTTPLRERASAQGKLGWAEAAVCSARAFLDDTLEQAWQRTLDGEPSSLRQKAELLLATTHAASSAAKVVELMYGAAGTSAIYARNPLERHFRDVQTLKQHGFLSESRYETVGQVYFGLPPDLAFVAF